MSKSVKPRARKPRPFTVHKVTVAGLGMWDVHIGPDDGDPWLTVRHDDCDAEPEVGDRIWIIAPYATKIEKATPRPRAGAGRKK